MNSKNKNCFFYFIDIKMKRFSFITWDSIMIDERSVYSNLKERVVVTCVK